MEFDVLHAVWFNWMCFVLFFSWCNVILFQVCAIVREVLSSKALWLTSKVFEAMIFSISLNCAIDGIDLVHIVSWIRIMPLKKVRTCDFRFANLSICRYQELSAKFVASVIFYHVLHSPWLVYRSQNYKSFRPSKNFRKLGLRFCKK